MLTVENDTGAALPRPGVYVLDARDGARVDWTVVDSASAPKGRASGRWSVRPCPSPSTSASSCCCSAARTTARSFRRSRGPPREDPPLGRRSDRRARSRWCARAGDRDGRDSAGGDGARRPRRCGPSSQRPPARSRRSCSCGAGAAIAPTEAATSTSSLRNPTRRHGRTAALRSVGLRRTGAAAALRSGPHPGPWRGRPRRHARRHRAHPGRTGRLPVRRARRRTALRGARARRGPPEGGRRGGLGRRWPIRARRVAEVLAEPSRA